MASSLSSLINNHTEGIHKMKCKDCDCCLEYESVKDDFIKYKCLSYNKKQHYWRIKKVIQEHI